jgi:CRP/FNR family cyclic AMP-dependent transcriptional regulator
VVTPEILNSFPFFAGLSAKELRSLSIIANQVSYKRGDRIFKEGQPAQALYMILQGWVDVVINTDAQGDHRELVTTLSPGDVLGWSAVVEPFVYTASAVCASPVSAIEFKGADLLGLFELDPKLCCVIMRRVCQAMSIRLRATRLQMVSLFLAH